jgi:hypothetical protein
MMASVSTVLLAALGATLFFSLLGSALCRWLKLGWSPGGSMEAVLGWAVFSAVTLPLQMLAGFTQVSTAFLVVAAGIASAATLLWLKREKATIAPLPFWAYGLAAAIALIPLIALLPRHVADGVIVGWTASDHSKVAMIDEMTRLGLPAGNPFFGWQGGRGVLSYYYLWHFSAAQLSILPGISGWEADAAMTGFTAYASLMLMMGLASRIDFLFERSMGADQRGAPPNPPKLRTAAIVWVTVLSLAGSLKPALSWVIGWGRLGHLLADYRDLETWLAQASWVPQHLASASCVVLAALLLVELLEKPTASRVVLLGTLAAAAFGSSAWIGGVAFAAIAFGVGLMVLIRGQGTQRLWFILSATGAAVIALVLAAPLLKAEFSTLGARHGAAPIAFHPFEVIGSLTPRHLRRFLDLPAYWLILLPIDLPAIYPAGVAAFVGYARREIRQKQLSLQMLALGILVVLSLTVSWLLASTIGNNDLGWRAMLPAVLVLTPMAAAGLARWIRIKAYVAAGAALVLVAVSVPERTAVGDITGKTSDDASDFADGPKLWQAVRRYAGPNDRVANNPLYLDDITGYPVNLSWAFFSNRPSCYSGWETARAYVDLPAKGTTALDDQFIRIFAGKAEPQDLRQMAQDYGCQVVVVTDSDGAWTQDPFATSPYYRLAEKTDEWKIYVSTPADVKTASQH